MALYITNVLLFIKIIITLLLMCVSESSVVDCIHSVLLVEMTTLRLRALLDRLNEVPLTPSDGAELCREDVLRDKSMAMSRMLRAAR